MVTLPELLCPICKEHIKIGISWGVCSKGHKFNIRNNIIDLLAEIDDEVLLEEEKHWDQYAIKGKTSIEVNSYIKAKIFKDYDTLFYKRITDEWPDYSRKNICVGEIGCGSGSAIRFLVRIDFAKVDYVGIDISLQSMLRCEEISTGILPLSWKVQFVRASANTSLFKDNSLDIVFSTSALHHLDVNNVIKWISKSLKYGGLFILNEPSEMNPFARLGRKIVRDFHTKGEKPLLPQNITKIASEYNLNLRYEKGLHFLSGPLMYCVEILHFPPPFSIFSYYVSRLLDRFVCSPSWNYSFIQVYRRE
jgi:SAM-dependent methyltransferase